MANRTIFIDETGTFARGANKSYIGGWVCKTDDVAKIKGLIKNSVQHFNDFLKIEQQENCVLSYPKDMHFMPLHLLEQRKGKEDNKITVPPHYAPEFFSHLFNKMQKLTVLVFRSTGKPAINPNEQATYIDILRHTLLQLVEQMLSDFNQDKISVVIATRRIPMLYGKEGIDDVSSYEKHLQEGIISELRHAFDDRQLNVHVSFANARKEPGLMMADFFCGALRWKKNAYLETFKVKKFPFANGYKQVANSIIQRVRFVEETDPPLAAIICADVLLGDPDNQKIKNALVSLLASMSTSDKAVFSKSMIDFLIEKLEKDPDVYSYLQEIYAFLDLLLSILPSDYHLISPAELQLIAAILLNKVRVDSHIGKVNCHNSIKQFLTFLDEYGEYAFDNQMQIMQQRIDATLISVQLNEFNGFKFNEIENILQDIKTQYYALFHFDLEHPVKDNNLARIEGTLGQMYGFLSDIEQDNDFFEMSELCLQTDISACIEGTASWTKANGYLTSLYWKKGDVDKTKAQFLIEADMHLKDPDAIFKLDNKSLFLIREKPFIYLHRLYLCALAAQYGTPISGLIAEKNYLLTECDVSSYPVILSAKWVAVMLLMANDYQNALEILDAALRKVLDHLDIIHLPLQLLHHHTLIKLGKKSHFDCQNEVEKYAMQSKEIKEVLIKLGIERYYQQEAEWSVYQVGSFLPFYLS